MESRTQKLYERAKEFTDQGTWKHSWHWPKGNHGLINTVTLKAALSSLCCNDMAAEISEAVNKIQDRYDLAEEIKDFIKFMEED